METGNKKIIYNPIVIMSIVVFVVGFGLGFYIWGYHKNEKKDYKAILKDAAAYVDGMERLNGDLTKEVETLKKDNSMLKSPSNAQIVALQSRIQDLERENNSFKSLAGQSQYLVQENARLNSELQTLKANTPGASPVVPTQPGNQQQSSQPVNPAARPYKQ